MYAHFTFANHSNPYIATTNESMFYMLCHYELEFDPNITEGFIVTGERPHHATSYKERKTLLEDFAKDWQATFSDYNYSYGHLLDYQSFFETYGKKYGLLREFHENAIC